MKKGLQAGLDPITKLQRPLEWFHKNTTYTILKFSITPKFYYQESYSQPSKDDDGNVEEDMYYFYEPIPKSQKLMLESRMKRKGQNPVDYVLNPLKTSKTSVNN